MQSYATSGFSSITTGLSQAKLAWRSLVSFTCQQPLSAVTLFLYSQIAMVDAITRVHNETPGTMLMNFESGAEINNSSLLIGVSSTLDRDQTLTAMQALNESCQLNLKTLPTLPTRHSLFALNAEANCTRLQQMEIRFYTEVAEVVLKCIEESFAAYVLGWEDECVSSSSSTAENKPESSSTANHCDTAETVCDPAEFWTNSTNYFLFFGGALIGALIAKLYYRHKRKQAEERQAAEDNDNTIEMDLTDHVDRLTFSSSGYSSFNSMESKSIPRRMGL
jgi:hypothetical protein